MVNVTESTKNITLHSHNLNISHSQVFKLPKPIPNEVYGREEEVEIYGTSEDKERQFYILHFDHKLEKDAQYRVHIQYVGNINDNLQGFYRSSYKMGSQTR